jgi:SAM-dependent methyltransferase
MAQSLEVNAGVGGASADGSVRKSSIEAAQALWGEGYVMPSEKRYAQEAVAAMKLSRDKDIAIFGASLCGAARDIAEALECRLSCYEWDSAFADACVPLNTRSPAGFLLRVVPVGLREGFPAGRQFDSILSFMRLHERPDKPQIVKQMAGAMKPGGQILLLDFLSGPEPLSPEKRSTLFPRLEGPATQVWRTADLHFALLSAGFKIDADVDISAKFRTVIVAGFAQMKSVVLSVLSSQPAGSERSSDALNRTVKLWAARHDALRDGLLAVRCTVATKAAATPPRPPKA